MSQAYKARRQREYAALANNKTPGCSLIYNMIISRTCTFSVRGAHKLAFVDCPLAVHHSIMTAAHIHGVPADFLQHPAPNIKVSRVDFEAANLPVYKGLYAVILDDVLSRHECRNLIKAAEASTTKGWERAMVNVGGGRQRMIEDVRNCGRIIWDSHDVVSRIWKRIEHIPEVQEIARLENVPKIFGNGPTKWNEVWKFTRPNERMRFLKYVGGEYFRPHCDGSYETPDRKERSYFTLHLYLNNADVVSKEEAERSGTAFTDSVLVGGATTFHGYVSHS